MEMFRERVFELTQNFAIFASAWSEIKLVAKARGGAPFVPPSHRRFSINSYRAEMNQKLGRGYIQPMANNR
ncbi:MAG: hypothetical protein ABSF82_05345 [Candidatus Bathyarchaeia archaeon]|jgi:hypothetical protein